MKEIEAIREEYNDYRGRHASWCYQPTKILNDMDARHEECTCHVKKIRTLIRALASKQETIEYYIALEKALIKAGDKLQYKLDDANAKIEALIEIRAKLEDDLSYLRGK